MKTVILAFATALALGAAGPAVAQNPSLSRDVGSMNYPSPLPQGNVSTTMPGRTPDTSGAAFPAPLTQGNFGATATGPARTPTDTGNMAYPAPVPQGAAGTTTVK